MGEELNAAEVTARGLLGDRAYALVDRSDGKVASAKNPRKWAKLFDFRAAFAHPPCPTAPIPPVRITLPDGTMVTSEQADRDHRLSHVLGRAVTLQAAGPQTPSLEMYWPDMEGLIHREAVTDIAMPANTFFDVAVIHVFTTATLDRLRELYPQGRFAVRRFRPNLVLEVTSGERGFVENAWIGHTLAIGGEVRLQVTSSCYRCVMTTLPQSELSHDPQILRTIVQHNQANAGVYAAVLQGGTLRRGDPVRFE
jgi:uncharacterized protein